jgi:hypothetical protein
MSCAARCEVDGNENGLQPKVLELFLHHQAETIFQFTKDNSPYLLTLSMILQVMRLQVVYFTTDNGIVSFQGIAPASL